MAASALYFSYPLAAAAIREHLVSSRTDCLPLPQKVRILLAADGQITSQAEAIAIAADCSPKQVALAPFPVDKSNRFLYHKTTSRQIYQQALAACPGYDDVILYNGDGEVTESSTANVVVDLDGVLCTPPVHCGLLAGTYRAWLLERNQIEERVIRADQLFQGHAIYLINSVAACMVSGWSRLKNTVTEP